MSHGFAAVQASTLCPYAKAARIVHGAAWRPSEGDADNWRRNAAALAAWAGTAELRRSHGFVIEIDEPEATSFARARERLKTGLMELSAHDPAASSCMNGPFETQDWQFQFAGLRLFVNVFAPCYRLGHSKHTGDPRRMFLFFQPEHSFDLCGVNSLNRPAKEFVRSRFREAGMPYDGELIDGRIEACLYMFPLAVGDEPVRWWD